MPEVKDKIEYKGKELSYGRYLFNKCLPENYPVVDDIVTSKKLIRILNDIGLKYPAIVLMNTLDKIKTLGFNYSTLAGYTLGIRDFIHEDLNDYKLSGDFSQDMYTMKNDQKIQTALRELPFATFIDSGARGSWDQARQIVLARGYVADADNNIRYDKPIRSNLLKGLTPEEFFNSCYGCRKGLMDTAMSTGDSGYLTRQLIYSTVIVELSQDEDCGTQDTLNINVKNAQIAKSLLWRYHIKEDGQKQLITHTNYQTLVGKIVKLRSPIYCKNKKICKTCYGNLHKILHSTQIGIIATQAVGERATQLVLRTFHISGAAQTKGQDKSDQKHHDIISGIGDVKRLFHNPTKYLELTSPEILVSAIYNVFEQYGDIQMVHFEVIVSSMMWYKTTPWRINADRDSLPIEYLSILQVPARASWLLGCAFANLKRKIITGLVEEGVDECSAITKLFRL